MNQLTWIEAFSLIDQHVRNGEHPRLVAAWRRLLRPPRSQIWGHPPSGQPASSGEAVQVARRFLETVSMYEGDGDGLELLLFRLVKAVEALPALMDGRRADDRDYRAEVAKLWGLTVKGARTLEIHGQIFRWAAEDSELRQAIREMWRERAEATAMAAEGDVDGDWLAGGLVNGDECYQAAYCDDCGMELSPDGDCGLCDGVTSSVR